ncbi:conserved protein of unknown function [Pseudodesulfovibrio profundus]|uniref:DUF697 domain-containing protein n=1 Tax=Pseudodesulfovibrio profundus TaxID=57320 RepID=A0A2C8F9T0_9BACT|nr:DUF697 domain-containing protein [Pseudodesulfovibrio profundus]SOB59537.1 conserved protein of unknown function [Pseudodesulfovibrio profundus]
MPKHLKHLVTFAAVIIIGSFLVFLYNCIVGLSGFAGRINPALEPWLFWTLSAVAGGLVLWSMAVAFMRPRPMMVHENPTEKEMEDFRRILLGRLRKNKYLRDAEVVINDASEMDHALAYLKEKADEEIRSTAKRVFISTAISQNGRLDVLVVLYLITRLNWRIAKLYNQRPHYRELMNLYANVAITAFVAGSLEDLGLEDHVTELMGPLVGGSAIGAVPGAQAISSTITNSVLTGSANGLMTLRCGILARNYMSLNLDSKGSMRRNATMEASRMFVSMSAETVTYVTRKLVKGTTGAMKSGSARAVRGVTGTVTGTAEAVGSGVRKVGQGVKSSASAVGETVRSVGDRSKQSVRKVSDGTRQAVNSTTGAVKSAVSSIGKQAKDTVSSVKEGTRKSGQKAADGARKLQETTSSLKRSAETVIEKSGKTVADSRRKTGKALSDISSSLKKKRESASKRIRGLWKRSRQSEDDAE